MGDWIRIRILRCYESLKHQHHREWIYFLGNIHFFRFIKTSQGKMLAYWQRVVVNGSYSDWSNVSSGVPQDTVLEPVLFLLYINDLPTGTSSEVRFVSWRYSSIPTNLLPDDQHRLQHDLHKLEQWAAKWQMRFAPTKCFVLSVTLRTNSPHFSHRLSDTTSICFWWYWLTSKWLSITSI